jgi:dynein heavy chain 2
LQGWTKFYEFSDADLRVSTEIILRICKEVGTAGTMRWDHVHGLLINAVYGGRVDNSFDMTVLETYIRQFFGPNYLSTTASARLAPGLAVPTSTHLQDYVGVVRELPDEDDPVYFGLPANINRSAQRSASTKVISGLKLLMRTDALADKFDRQLWARELEPVIRMWGRLHQSKDLLKMRVQPPDEKLDPIAAFVALELYNASRLVHQVDTSIKLLAQ